MACGRKPPWMWTFRCLTYTVSHYHKQTVPSFLTNIRLSFSTSPFLLFYLFFSPPPSLTKSIQSLPYTQHFFGHRNEWNCRRNKQKWLVLFIIIKPIQRPISSCVIVAQLFEGNVTNHFLIVSETPPSTGRNTCLALIPEQNTVVGGDSSVAKLCPKYLYLHF